MFCCFSDWILLSRQTRARIGQTAAYSPLSLARRYATQAAHAEWRSIDTGRGIQ